ncbi:AaceriACR141Wp [[Ashbya] aceris (nom. inval.)]|nr:AaceriACR141Wp [[Ashbya] aceris (nom. inval.)]
MLLGRLRSKAVLNKYGHGWIRVRTLLLFVLGIALYQCVVWYASSRESRAGEFIRLTVPATGSVGGGAPALREEEWLMMSDKDRWRANYEVVVRYLAAERNRGHLHPVVPFAWADWVRTKCPRREPRCGEFNGEVGWDGETGPVVQRVVVVTEGRNLETQAAQGAAAGSGVFGRGRMAGRARQMGTEDAQDALAAMRREEVVGGWRVRALQLPRLEQRTMRTYRGVNKRTVELAAPDFELEVAAARRATARAACGGAHPAYKEYVGQLAMEYVSPMPPRPGKYFSEPEKAKWPEHQKHLDARFYWPMQSRQRAQQLRRLVRCWEQFAKNEQLLYWLAHGSLLGWYWQGTGLEWDADHDVQLPLRQLEYLALHFNASLFLFEDGGEVGRYYLDINDHYKTGEKDSENIIDGRLIDIDSGLFLDFTGIRVKQGTYTDGSRHTFTTLDYLNPLRVTVFDGKDALVPHAITSVLSGEYRDGLIIETFRGHHYDKDVCGWVSSECEECFDRELAREWRAHADARADFCKRHDNPLYTECQGILKMIPPNPPEEHIARLSSYFKEHGY